MALDLRGGFVFLALSTHHPDRVRIGRSSDVEAGDEEGGWRIAYARRVHFPQTIERIMRDHLSRLDDNESPEGEYVAPYGHAQMVLDSLAREFDLAR